MKKKMLLSIACTMAMLITVGCSGNAPGTDSQLVNESRGTEDCRRLETICTVCRLRDAVFLPVWNECEHGIEISVRKNSIRRKSSAGFQE